MGKQGSICQGAFSIMLAVFLAFSALGALAQDLPEGQVALRSFHGPYLVEGPDGRVAAMQADPAQALRFEIVRNPDGTVSLRSENGAFLGQTGNRAVLQPESVNTRFEPIQHADGAISLRSVSNGRFLAAERNGVLNINRQAAREWEQFRFAAILDSDAGYASDGDWRTPGGAWLIRFDGPVGIIVEGGDAARPIGTDMVRILRPNGSAFAGEVRFSNGAFVPCIVVIDGNQMRFEAAGYSWVYERATPVEAALEDPTRLEEIVAGLGIEDAAGRAAASEVVEIALDLVLKLAPSGILEELGVSADAFAVAALESPETIFAAGLADIGSDLAVGAASGLAGRAVAEFLFTRTPLGRMPERLQNPGRALIEAAVVEGAGLASAGSNPSAVIAPAVNRIHDAVEIYEASKGAAREQEGNLLSVALGAEITARLVTDYPGERSEAVSAAWLAETREALPGMVGSDDAGAVGEILSLGHAALLSERSGNKPEAVAGVRKMLAIGEAADGPFLLSAEGPTDLLVKLAAGGDAPLRAAKAFISATSLAEVVRRERIAEAMIAMPEGEWGGNARVRGAIAEIMSSLSPKPVPGCAALYGPVPKEMWRSLFAGYRADVSARGRQSTVVMTSSMMDADRFCLGDRMSCLSGAPPLEYCASGEALFFSGQTRILALYPLPENPQGPRYRAPLWVSGPGLPNADSGSCELKLQWPQVNAYRWHGACDGGKAQGPGLFQAMRGEQVVWQMQVGAGTGAVIKDGVLWYDLDLPAFTFELTYCDQGLSHQRHVRVTAPSGTPPGFFWNTAMVDVLRQRAAEVATELCPTDKGYANVSFSAHLAGDNAQAMASGRNYDANALTWRESGNKPAGDLQNQLNQAERIRVIEAQKRAQEAQAQALKAQFDRQRAALVARAEAFVDGRNGFLEDLAMALEIDEIAALGALEREVKLFLRRTEETRSGTSSGKMTYSATYRVASPFAALEKEYLLRKPANWETFLDLAQSSRGDQLTLTCTFARLADIPQSDRQVSVKLSDFSSNGNDRQIQAQCR